tara:strand:+ start:275 stop:553 length:279 start_codon:yes stop_codon:yes gene_type:complete
MNKIEEIIEKLGFIKDIDNLSIESLIMRNWKNIVPSNLIHKCSPESIKESRTLVIRASSKMVFEKLKFSETSIQRKAKEITNGVITKIELLF